MPMPCQNRIRDNLHLRVFRAERAANRDNLIAPKIPSALFTWARGTREFVQEASTLEANGCAPGRLYSDAADVGFTVVSARTGQEADFYFSYNERDSEHDLQATHYLPTPETVRRMPQLAGVTVIILND